jgi:hypothetical protein
VQPALVTGDTMGRVSILRPTGELLAEFDSGDDLDMTTLLQSVNPHLDVDVLLLLCAEMRQRVASSTTAQHRV